LSGPIVSRVLSPTSSAVLLEDSRLRAEDNSLLARALEYMTPDRVIDELLSVLRIVGLNPNIVLAELERVLTSSEELPQTLPFGDGKAPERIVEIAKRVIY